ncbi:MAG: phosphoribosyltransferase family protein [Weeksellaceae bacterium]|nr:phosphoribosyltransferase family protein [Weeksellaceae bacterium]
MKVLRELFFPYRCCGCLSVHGTGSEPICANCLLKLEYTYWKMDQKNELYEQLSSSVKLNAATAVLWFEKNKVSQKLIHAHKYRNQPQTGKFLAALCWEVLATDRYDFISCIPSHKHTLRTRGYNQAMEIAEHLTSHCNAEILPNLVKRVKRKKSQTQYKKALREKNLIGAFALDETSQISGKKLLVIDDVYTTGATMRSYLQTLEPLQCEIDVLIMARAR